MINHGGCNAKNAVSDKTRDVLNMVSPERMSKVEQAHAKPVAHLSSEYVDERHTYTQVQGASQDQCYHTEHTEGECWQEDDKEVGYL